MQKKVKCINAYLFLLPSLIGVSYLLFIPFLDSIRRSFVKLLTNEFVGIANYLLVYKNEAFQLAAKNTLRFTFICIPLLMVASLILALLVNELNIASNFFKSTFLLPMVVPTASIVVLWRYLFSSSGLLDKLLLSQSSEPIYFLDSEYAFAVLVISYLWKNIGYNMILWIASINNIPDSCLEAARIDGARKFQILRYVTLPLLKPTLFTITVLSIINSFKVFREAYLVAGDYPHESIYFIQHLFNNWFTALEIQKLCAASVIILIILIAFIFLTWLITRVVN